MKLYNSQEIFKSCLKHNYAVAAFNFVNIETLKAITQTCQKLNSPVVIQCSTSAIKYMGVECIANLVKAQNLTIPVCLNLDHGQTFEDCKAAIDNGFTNVMIDGSHLPFEKNIELTKQVVEYAHSKNVTVEAELGVLAGVEDNVVASDSQSSYTNPQQAKEFVQRTNVDSLAIAIGTKHGTVKFTGDAQLRFDILAEIEELLPNFPFVLHGASSIPSEMVELCEQYGAKLKGANGVPADMLKQAITEHNICKVNVDSDLRISFTAGVREYLFNNPNEVDLRKYSKNGMDKIEQVITKKLLASFNCQDKAKLF